jgi:hypothetical protein
MKTLLLCGLGTLLGLPALAQTAAPDTSLLAATTGLRQQYAHALRDESSLYSGPVYVNYVRPGTLGHRFFDSNEPQAATITYGGITYAGVAARYDLVRDQVVLSAQGGTLDLSLVNERVARFTLGEHTFVRVVGDSATGLPERPAFYELLVPGPVRVLAAYRKKYVEGLQASRIVSDITARSTDYFIQKEGRCYAASKMGDVLRLFPQQKAALRSYAQTNKLVFDEAGRAAALMALVRYQATLGAATN